MKNIIVWDPTASFKFLPRKDCILEGPEDDSVRIEIHRICTTISKSKSFPLQAQLNQRVRGD